MNIGGWLVRQLVVVVVVRGYEGGKRKTQLVLGHSEGVCEGGFTDKSIIMSVGFERGGEI